MPFQEPLPQPRSIAGAPLGPRADLERPPLVPIVDTEELDDLFPFTTKAQPKLYFKPVDKELANNRLDRMEDITSKNYDYDSKATGEINRYTFENDELVDRGPEIFPGLRPPRGFRGPVFSGGRPRGGFGGRGGGAYGGVFPARDSYRGPGGEGYRGDGYGGDRRYRDDRRS